MEGGGGGGGGYLFKLALTDKGKNRYQSINQFIYVITQDEVALLIQARGSCKKCMT